MIDFKRWQLVGWKHSIWELVRFFHSLRGNKGKFWLAELEMDGNEFASLLKINKKDILLLKQYIEDRDVFFKKALSLLRTEEQAQLFCKSKKFNWKVTATKSKDHHQASKALIATVDGIAKKICDEFGLTVNTGPQNRCVWKIGSNLHVTARNLDGAVPSTNDPFIIWEIKEYWGKTKGGSKMSDAVYECHLVGREIREFEERAKTKIQHLVFIDGKDQWLARESDLKRLIDLTCQGLIDDLFIGKDVEVRFGNVLKEILKKRLSN